MIIVCGAHLCVLFAHTWMCAKRKEIERGSGTNDTLFLYNKLQLLSALLLCGLSPPRDNISPMSTTWCVVCVGRGIWQCKMHLPPPNVEKGWFWSDLLHFFYCCDRVVYTHLLYVEGKSLYVSRFLQLTFDNYQIEEGNKWLPFSIP